MNRLFIALTLALTQFPQEAIVEKYNIGICAHQSNNGAYTLARDFAAYEWQTDSPKTEDHPMIIDLGEQSLRLAIYCNGQFTDGQTIFDPPIRWAYVRYIAEVWDGDKWVMPDGSIPPVPPDSTTGDGVHMDAEAGQRLTDELKRSFTVNEINRMMEASPYDEPDQGAPLD